MNVDRSGLMIATFSLMLGCLLIFSIPVVGMAQAPHTCPSGHQGMSLGGNTNFNFIYAKNCSPYTSSAIAWRYDVYRYADNVWLCGEGPNAIGQTPRTKSCSGLPLGAYPRVKVVISYQTTSGGSWMTHTELYGN